MSQWEQPAIECGNFCFTHFGEGRRGGSLVFLWLLLLSFAPSHKPNLKMGCGICIYVPVLGREGMNHLELTQTCRSVPAPSHLWQAWAACVKPGLPVLSLGCLCFVYFWGSYSSLFILIKFWSGLQNRGEYLLIYYKRYIWYQPNRTAQCRYPHAGFFGWASLQHLRMCTGPEALWICFFYFYFLLL